MCDWSSSRLATAGTAAASRRGGDLDLEVSGELVFLLRLAIGTRLGGERDLLVSRLGGEEWEKERRFLDLLRRGGETDRLCVLPLRRGDGEGDSDGARPFPLALRGGERERDDTSRLLRGGLREREIDRSL